MKRGPDRVPHDSLVEVQRRFEQWRSLRALGTRIPEDLWQAAVDVGQEHGASKTARALGLDYYGLKERLESATEDGLSVTPSHGRGFVEIPLSAPVAGPECVLELTGAHGARLRLELKGAAPAQVQTLARTFWSLVQ